jgi:hypothetical protein
VPKVRIYCIGLQKNILSVQGQIPFKEIMCAGITGKEGPGTTMRLSTLSNADYFNPYQKMADFANPLNFLYFLFIVIMFL